MRTAAGVPAPERPDLFGCRARRLQPEAQLLPIHPPTSSSSRFRQDRAQEGGVRNCRRSLGRDRCRPHSGRIAGGASENGSATAGVLLRRGPATRTAGWTPTDSCPAMRSSPAWRTTQAALGRRVASGRTTAPGFRGSTRSTSSASPSSERVSAVSSPGSSSSVVHFLRKRKSALLIGVGEDVAIVSGHIGAFLVCRRR